MRSDNEQMAQPPAAESLRLIFEYDGDRISLVSQQPVNVAPPPSRTTAPIVERTGFWAEIRDERLGVLYRQNMHDPVMSHPEVFSNEPGQTIARSVTPRKKGAFTIIVPRLDTSDHLALIRMDPEARSKAAARTAPAVPAGEIARFTLKPQAPRPSDDPSRIRPPGKKRPKPRKPKKERKK